jgi:hypothetical protein
VSRSRNLSLAADPRPDRSARTLEFRRGLIDRLVFETTQDEREAEPLRQAVHLVVEYRLEVAPGWLLRFGRQTV